MALLVSYDNFIKTNEDAIRAQIELSLEGMDPKQIEEFGKNVASLVTLVNESADLAFIEQDKQVAKAAEDEKFKANLAAYDAVKAAEKAAEDEKFKANLAAYDATKEDDKINKEAISTIKEYKKGIIDFIKTRLDITNSNVNKEIDKLKTLRHDYNVEKMNRSLTSAPVINKDAILDSLDTISERIEERLKNLESLIDYIKPAKNWYLEAIKTADATIASLTELLKNKKTVSTKDESSVIIRIYHESLDLIDEEIRKSMDGFNQIADILDLSKHNLAIEQSKLAALISGSDYFSSKTPISDNVKDVKQYSKYLSAYSSSMKTIKDSTPIARIPPSGTIQSAPPTPAGERKINTSLDRLKARLGKINEAMQKILPQFKKTENPFKEESQTQVGNVFAAPPGSGVPTTEINPFREGQPRIPFMAEASVPEVPDVDTVIETPANVNETYFAPPPPEQSAPPPPPPPAGPVQGAPVSTLQTADSFPETYPTDETDIRMRLESRFKRVYDTIQKLLEVRLKTSAQYEQIKKAIDDLISALQRGAIQGENDPDIKALKKLVDRDIEILKAQQAVLALTGKGRRKTYRRHVNKKARKTFRRHK